MSYKKPNVGKLLPIWSSLSIVVILVATGDDDAGGYGFAARAMTDGNVVAASLHLAVDVDVVELHEEEEDVIGELHALLYCMSTTRDLGLKQFNVWDVAP